jgi:hypothetical protein
MLAKSNMPAALLTPVRRLPLRDAMSLHDALRTISDVVSGLHCQPRFKACDIDRARNAAGLELDEWVSAIEFRMEQLVDDVRASRPTDELSQDARIEFLLKHELENDPTVADIASAAVRAAFQDRF